MNDENDLVTTELFIEALRSLEGTTMANKLANFMDPDIDLESENALELRLPGLPELKQYLLNQGVVTQRELDEKIQAILKKLPDLKLDQQTRMATWQPKAVERLAKDLGIKPSEEE